MIAKIQKRIDDYTAATIRATAMMGPPSQMDAMHDEGFIAGLEVALGIVEKEMPILRDALHDLESSHGLYVHDGDVSETFQLEHSSIKALKALVGEG